MSDLLGALSLWLKDPRKSWLLRHGLHANGGTLVVTIAPSWPSRQPTVIRISNVDRYSVRRSSWPDDGPYGMEYSAIVSALLTSGEVVTESAESLTVEVETP